MRPNFHATGAARSRQTDEHAEDAHPHPGEKGHRGEDRQQRDRRAEVRFLRDERQREEREHAADGEIGPRGRAAVFAEELGEDERHADLREFRRLQIESVERDPPARPHLHGPEEHDVQQQREHADVDEMRLVRERAVIERERDDHCGEAEHDGVHLRDMEA